MRIGMSDGTELLLIGSAQLDTLQGSKHEMLVANSFAGDLPVRVEAALPFTTARASFVQLYFVLTLVACGMSGALLLVALQYVRRGNVPDFDLERAIVNGEIKPYYQPVVNTQTGRVVGCEMLARWIGAPPDRRRGRATTCRSTPPASSPNTGCALPAKSCGS